MCLGVYATLDSGGRAPDFVVVRNKEEEVQARNIENLGPHCLGHSDVNAALHVVYNTTCVGRSIRLFDGHRYTGRAHRSVGATVHTPGMFS